ncbi:MAG: hypothetical protein PHX87_00565 [Candidatus Peribacteraceae bacterium]|nr:hypothetical protein [Candidatus Peribacteraceae bacterium]MDD5741900.1 hypothetical protein [Candidatus Peribacteraceae bacterium]
MSININIPIMGVGRNEETQLPVGMLLIHKERFEMVQKVTKTLGFYAHDQGGNNALNSVAQTALGAGMVILRVPDVGGDVPGDVAAQMAQCSALVLGISSDDRAGREARLALAALGHNAALDGKIVFVEDFPGSTGVQNADHQAIGPHAHLCAIAALPQDAPERKVYRGVHAVGSPDHWIDYMKNIHYGEEFRQSGAVRKRRRGTTESVPLGSGEVVFYVSGCNTPSVDTAILKALYARETIAGRPFVVHFRAHPGERKRLAELAADIAERDRVLGGGWELANSEVVDAGGVTDSRLLGVSDIPILHPFATAVFHLAALRRRGIAVRECITPTQLAGSATNPKVADNFVHVIDRLSGIGKAAEELLRDDSEFSVALRKRQEASIAAFDPDQPPTFGKNVFQFVQDIVERR